MVAYQHKCDMVVKVRVLVVPMNPNVLNDVD